MTGTAAKATGIRTRGRAALANRDNYTAPYLSPFYSPYLSFHCGTGPGSAGAPRLGWFGTWWIVTPAVIILIFPLGFRLTCCSYYRKAYYRSWWLSPPACPVPEPRRRYSGETRFPLLGQNIHRPGAYHMQQADLDRSQEFQFRKCIECWLCRDVCHVIRDHDDNKNVYAGPGASSGAPCCARSRAWTPCNITKSCTEVCPAGIKITDNAIIPMKERSAGQRYDLLSRVLRSWRRREGRPPAG